VIHDTVCRLDDKLSVGSVNGGVDHHTVRENLLALLAALSLAPGAKLFPVLRRLVPAKSTTRVILAIPHDDTGTFSLEYFETPGDVPKDVVEACQWLQANHRPRFLNQTGFEQLVQEAKGQDHAGWKKRYLNIPGSRRRAVVSVCGWVYARGETVFSDKASDCLAYDHSVVDDLRAQGYSDEVLGWLAVGSLIATPVYGQDAKIAAVLLIVGTSERRLRPRDVEIAGIWARFVGQSLARPQQEGAASHGGQRERD
jgi:GAF domain-containing protein